MDQVKNFSRGRVSGPYESTDTEIGLEDGHASRFPTPPFNAVWWNASDYPDPADDPDVEIVRITAIDVDVLTIDRAQEGTSQVDHNLAGKTYMMVAGMTAKTIAEDLVGDIFGSGPALVFDSDIPSARLQHSNTDDRFIQLAVGDITIQSVRVFLGDTQAVGNAGVLDIDDGNSRVVLSNLDLATTQSQSATGPVGSVVGKLAIRDGSGTLLGYLPIYGSIT